MAVWLDPGDADAHCNLGLLLGERKDVGGAEEAHRTAIRLDPDNADDHFALGVLLGWMKSDWAGAEGAFVRALELNPAHAQAKKFLPHIRAQLRK